MKNHSQNIFTTSINSSNRACNINELAWPTLNELEIRGLARGISNVEVPRLLVQMASTPCSLKMLGICETKDH